MSRPSPVPSPIGLVVKNGTSFTISYLCNFPDIITSIEFSNSRRSLVWYGAKQLAADLRASEARA
ncbi:hypothetical protein [Kribbella rubisoli]|uniref:hypothetical protein n=1 Tax=Kribbella rubisoli TaxID=3075929 RepID=UPI0018E4F39C|nr:hypothetical protein [Kribbella rubisoli]